MSYNQDLEEENQELREKVANLLDEVQELRDTINSLNEDIVVKDSEIDEYIESVREKEHGIKEVEKELEQTKKEKDEIDNYKNDIIKALEVQSGERIKYESYVFHVIGNLHTDDEKFDLITETTIDAYNKVLDIMENESWMSTQDILKRKMNDLEKGLTQLRTK